MKSCTNCTPEEKCLFHAAPREEAKVQKTKLTPEEIEKRARMLSVMLSRLLGHEGCGRWVGVPSPFTELGCQFCERPWREHAPDCFYTEVSAILESNRVD